MLRTIGSVFLVLGLSACAAKNIEKDFSFEKYPQDGIAILSISHDKVGISVTKVIFYLNGSPTDKNYRQLESSEDIVPGVPSRKDNFKEVGGRLLVIQLPEGKHALTSWQIVGNTVYIRPSEHPEPLTFDIKAGEIKYIGNFHIHPETGKNVFGLTVAAGGYPVIRNENKRDIALLEDRYPQFTGKVLIEPLKLGPWYKSVGTNREIKIPPPVVR